MTLTSALNPLVAAVITQLFSSMIRKGIQWGYVFVGEAIIFLYIPDDPPLSVITSPFQA